jgi:hypothetical protein
MWRKKSKNIKALLSSLYIVLGLWLLVISLDALATGCQFLTELFRCQTGMDPSGGIGKPANQHCLKAPTASRRGFVWWFETSTFPGWVTRTEPGVSLCKHLTSVTPTLSFSLGAIWVMPLWKNFQNARSQLEQWLEQILASEWFLLTLVCAFLAFLNDSY